MNPTSVNFGSVTTGSSSVSQSVAITNTGARSLTLSGYILSSTAFSFTSTPPAPLSLNPGETTHLSVSFSPNTAGNISGTLTVSSNAGSGSNTVALTGTGLQSTKSPLLSASVTSLAFGNVNIGSSSSQNVVLSNSGGSSLTISQASVVGTGFKLNTPTLPLTLNAGQTTSLSITFAPAATGNATGSLSVIHGDSVSPLTISLSGSGVQPTGSQITLNPIAVGFGSQTLGTTSVAQSVAISNTGTSSVTLTGYKLSSTSFVFASTPPAPLSLQPGETTHLSVSFTPNTAGNMSGTVTVSSNASSGSNTIALSGTGGSSTSSPQLSVSPTSVAFGSINVGATSSTQVVTLKNTGAAALSLSAITASPSSFAIVSKPSLPATLAPGGTTQVLLSLTPTAAGTISGTLTVTSNAPSSPNTVSLTGAGSQVTTSSLTITTSSLPSTTVQQAYTTTLSATGGIAPYSWSITSGQLPGGLTLSPSTGTISGMPTQSGQFAIGIQVADSSVPTQAKASATLTLNVSAASTGGSSSDIYGGATQLSCPNGPAAHFYTQKIGSRWWLCTPSGNVFWLRGVYHADASDTNPDYQGVTLNGTACTTLLPATPLTPCSVITQKYGSLATWGPQMVQRLKAWGFNATAEYSSSYVQPTATNSAWTSTPDKSNPQKMPFTGLLWPSHYARNSNSYAAPLKDLVGPTKSSVYIGLRHAFFDVFDPNFNQWLQKDLADYTNAEYNWIHSSHSDYLIGFNVDDTDELFGFGAGADFPSFTDGQPDDHVHAHLGWITLVTPPTQSSGTDANGNQISYSDTTVYSKKELGSWLSTRYSGSISLLNANWGSNYTTFGSNGGWGSGSGVLDEDGTHTWVPKDPYKLTGATAAMQKDLDDFLLHLSQQYFAVIKSALQTAAPGVLYLGPTNMGGWGAPPRRQILQAAGQYVDVFMLSTIPTLCSSCTDDQQRADFIAQYGGDKPWANWEGFFAQPDSYMSVYPAPGDSAPPNSSQPLRGQMFQTMLNGLLNAKDSITGTFHIVGYKWWELYDNRGEQANWGLLTRRDNAYDGTSSVISTALDLWGFLTGGEKANYGDFIGPVTTANQNIYKTLLGIQ